MSAGRVHRLEEALEDLLRGGHTPETWGLATAHAREVLDEEWESCGDCDPCLMGDPERCNVGAWRVPVPRPRTPNDDRTPTDSNGDDPR